MLKVRDSRLVVHDFLDCENRPVSSSYEDLAFFVLGLLGFRVDGHVQELSISVTLPCKGCALTVGVLDSCTFIERCSILTDFDVSSPQSKLKRFQLALGDAKNQGSRGSILQRF